ncbi:hypothetical protein AHAS_Ahas20G0144200 [Arachis hypogaea]
MQPSLDLEPSIVRPLSVPPSMHRRALLLPQRLGSDATDRLVHLVQEVQHSVASKAEDTTLCGAKITGGGSGGTVCVIGRNCLKSGEQNIEKDENLAIYNSLVGASDD